MLDLPTYEVWTQPFSAGSTYQGHWNQGEYLRFLDGKGSGMVAHVAALKPYELVELHHQYQIDNTKTAEEQMAQAKEEGWFGAIERYSFTKTGDQETELLVSVAVPDEWKTEAETMWNTALEKLVEICIQ